MPRSRIPALALAADLVAVVVFAAVGRVNHAESGDLWGLLVTLAPFAVGVGAAWATPVVRADPSGLRAGAVVLAGAVVVGLALRAGFTGRLPVSFAVVTALSLAVLLLGWRALSLVVARRAAHRVP
ncbi:DUF3054 domain-containing protein [Pseudonocardia hydrocarbonoxydans]|uniref:DUF3054 domain-containing protein n=1 Tax=Pseudonocardia hydrocarbonoxydans TaxID=76726 RepID=A0A4Y3WPY4_9PSEU|nr:DUF3054 domain-containing protein [Pseudonocardia hydrocarbonoxydans]GEC20937.1 hypothetical protein PHY01_32200 [Pseudonocardia hydrocarbonoxydans]